MSVSCAILQSHGMDFPMWSKHDRSQSLLHRISFSIGVETRSKVQPAREHFSSPTQQAGDLWKTSDSVIENEEIGKTSAAFGKL